MTKRRWKWLRKKWGQNTFLFFFSKYVIFNFHHFLSKVAPLGDVLNSKKKIGYYSSQNGTKWQKNVFSVKVVNFSDFTDFSNFTDFNDFSPLWRNTIVKVLKLLILTTLLCPEVTEFSDLSHF